MITKYYAQRAGFGLILTECSQISPLSNAFPGSGVFRKSSYQRTHQWLNKISTKCNFNQNSSYLQERPHPVPKEMTKKDIKKVVEEFRQRAKNAIKGGFDGVQLHGANSYLVYQFLRDGSNKRIDEYGGSIQNLYSFLLECLDTLISVFGADRVRIKLFHTKIYNDMYDSNPLKLMKNTLKEMEKKKITFVEIKRHGPTESEKENFDQFGQEQSFAQILNFFDEIKKYYPRALIANNSINQKEAEELLKSSKADLISFEQLAISNPDLPEGFKNNQELTQGDYKTLFSQGRIY